MMESASELLFGCAVLLPGFAPLALIAWIVIDHIRTVDREDVAQADYERELADEAKAQRKRMEQLP